MQGGGAVGGGCVISVHAAPSVEAAADPAADCGISDAPLGELRYDTAPGIARRLASGHGA